MRPSQLGEWAAFWTLDPQGPSRGDLQAGVIASTLANIHRDTKKRPRPFTVGDFTLKFGESAPARRFERGMLREWFPERFKAKPKG